MAKLTEPFDANGDESGANKRARYHHATRKDWLARALRLPGKSLHLATVLQSLAKAQSTRQVELSNVVCQEFSPHVTPNTARSAGLRWWPGPSEAAANLAGTSGGHP
jgi:hypothetical protein